MGDYMDYCKIKDKPKSKRPPTPSGVNKQINEDDNMMKSYYSSSEGRRLREQSNVMFEEASSGVYKVIKDRHDIYSDYVTFKEVIEALNNEEKVAVKSANKTYSNFDLR